MSAGWLLALVVIGCLLAAFAGPTDRGGYRGSGKPWNGEKPPKTPSSVTRREED